MQEPENSVDVLVIGAGISGVSAGYYLSKNCPELSYAILESRSAIGGTWDLFRYPGIRSDSDLYTFGFSFRRWSSDKAIADGASILSYIRDTARAFGIDRHIHFGLRVARADWNSTDCRWRVEAIDEAGAARVFSCRFLYSCAGYYRYDSGFRPQWPGMQDFDGPIVHPQFWPENLDYVGKKVALIGSGATAVTLAPALSLTASKVTMVQRSPTYLYAARSHDKSVALLKRILPGNAVFAFARWKAILSGAITYHFARRWPNTTRRLLLNNARRRVAPDFDLEKHLSPKYRPWDQRICLVPDGDFYNALITDKIELMTDRIRRFTRSGIELESGQTVDADIIVTATGLEMQVFGGAQICVDGVAVSASNHFLYKGMMLDGVPNFAMATGYTNASWTLRCELTSRYVTRLLNHMQAMGKDWCMPVRGDQQLRPLPMFSFSSGYIKRALPSLPKQGHRKPWRLKQNYFIDLVGLKFSRIDDGTMQFGGRLAEQSPGKQVTKGTEPVSPDP